METGNHFVATTRVKELKVTDCKPKRTQTCTDPDCHMCQRREIDEADTGPGRSEP